MISATPSMRKRMPKTRGTARVAAAGELNSRMPDEQVEDAEDKRSDATSGKAADDSEDAHDDAEHAEIEDECGRQEDRGKQRMVEHEYTGDDTEDADERRPDPRD